MTLFLCDLPNPIHGMSNINKYIVSEFATSVGRPIVINTAPSYASSLFGSIIWPVVKFFHFFGVCFHLFWLLLTLKPKVVYRAINGGIGQWYDIAYLLIFRCFSLQVVIHHHSFSYLNSESKLFRVVKSVLKDEDRHIVLGEAMRFKLVALYGIKNHNIHVISNLAFFDKKGVEFSIDDSRRFIRVGHLANLSFEKGLMFFVETMHELRGLGVNLVADIAGPCSSSAVSNYVRESCEKNSCIHYHGPLYGNEKNVFFEKLDIFLFPSFYVNEAEPLVLYEAAQFGVFVMGTGRGCMSEQIINLKGYRFSDDVTPSLVARQIKTQLDEGYLTGEQRNQRLTYFSNEIEKSNLKLSIFIEQLRNGYVPRFVEI
jgi:glycosyltransferase involved in cell wall biosynthesis